MGHAGQSCHHFGDHVASVQVAPAVAHTAAGDEHFGFDLPEPVQHGASPHVGRAQAPDAANAGGRQEGHDGFGNIRQISRHPVARLHALGLQVQGQRGDLAAQLGPAQLARRLAAGQAGLAMADDGWQAAGFCGFNVAKNLLRIVACGAGKPLRARHFALAQHRAVGRRRLHFKIVPDALPVSIKIGDRPAPQRLIAFKSQSAGVLQPVLVAADLGHLVIRKGRHGASLPVQKAAPPWGFPGFWRLPSVPFDSRDVQV